MSQVYVNEPATAGVVALKTTHGEIEIALFAQQAPKACEKFLRRIARGAYDGRAFDRVARGFIAQVARSSTTNDRAHSLALDDEDVSDEFHSRVRFNARGRVAMAGRGRDGGDAFFIALDALPELDRKHTIFGKVSGVGMFNVFAIAEVTCDQETPIDPKPRVISAYVVEDPFAEKRGRGMEALPSRVIARGDGKGDDVDVVDREDYRKPSTSSKGKRLHLLSFGDEAEKDEEATVSLAMKIKSSHDVASDGRLAKADDEETLDVVKRTERERAAAKEAKERARASAADDDDGDGRWDGTKRASGWDDDDDAREKTRRDANDDAAGFGERMRAKMVAKRREFGDVEGGLKDVERDVEARAAALEEKVARDKEREKRREEKAARERAKREREASKLKKLGLGKKALSVEDAALLNDAEVKRIETKVRKSRVVNREKHTLARLAEFNSAHASVLKSQATEAAEAAAAPERSGAAGISRFVPQGLYYMEDDDDDASDWRTHKLAFVETKRDMQYAPTVDDYEFVDPLLEKGKGKFAKDAPKRA